MKEARQELELQKRKALHALHELQDLRTETVRLIAEKRSEVNRLEHAIEVIERFEKGA